MTVTVTLSVWWIVAALVVGSVLFAWWDDGRDAGWMFSGLRGLFVVVICWALAGGIALGKLLA